MFQRLLPFYGCPLHEGWKKRIDWYLIPQSILGLFLFVPFIDGLDIIKLVVFILYTLFTLYLLHRRNWATFTIIPILIATIFFVDYVSYLEKYVGIGLILVVFFTLQLFGKYWYQTLISLQSKPIEIDWYTLISSLYIILLFVMISDSDPYMASTSSAIVGCLLLVFVNESILDHHGEKHR